MLFFLLLGYIEYGADRKKNSESNINFVNEIDCAIVDAVVKTENERIVDYFSDEFSVKGYRHRYMHGADNSIIYPFIADIIEGLINIKKYDSAEKVLRKTILHNRNVFERVSKFIETSIKETYELELNAITENIDEMRKNGLSEEEIEKIKNIRLNKERMKDIVLNRVLKYDEEKHFISADHMLARGFVFNIIDVDTRKISNAPDTIQNLLAELNDWYRKVIKLGGDRNC